METDSSKNCVIFRYFSILMFFFFFFFFTRIRILVYKYTSTHVLIHIHITVIGILSRENSTEKQLIMKRIATLSKFSTAGINTKKERKTNKAIRRRLSDAVASC